MGTERFLQACIYEELKRLAAAVSLRCTLELPSANLILFQTLFNYSVLVIIF